MELRMSVVILALIWNGCKSFPVADRTVTEGQTIYNSVYGRVFRVRLFVRRALQPYVCPLGFV